MKVIFATMLFVLSSLAHAGDVLTDLVSPQVDAFRSQLLKDFGPFKEAPAVAELVKKMEIRDVEVRVSTHEIPGGADYFPGVIFIGSDIAARPREQLAFVLAHEYGHHTGAHWKATFSRGLSLASAEGKHPASFDELAPFIVKAVTPETSRHDELDADRAAIVTLKKLGLYDAKAVSDLLVDIGMDTSDTHPGASERLANIALVP